MAKIRLTGATFNAAAKTVAHTSFSDVTLAGIQLIVNVTDQIIIYNFADTSKGGTLATDTLTLEYDTTSMSDTDELMILVEDGAASIAINDGGNTITVDGTITANLAAGTNNIGDVDILSIAAGDNNIGNVDIASIAAGDNNIGNVDVVSSALPTGAATLAEQQTQTTALQLIDDAIGTLGTTTYTEATSKGMLIGAVRRDADTPLANTTNEYSPLITDANGYLKVEVFSGGTLPVSVASGGIASGAIASGAVASGAFASGSIASGAIAAGAIAAGATSIADNEDVQRAAADRLVKVAQVRVDAPVSGANVSGTEDYTQFIADVYGKTWVAGSVTEDVAHAAGESLMGGGVRRIDTPATSAGNSGDWATMDASAEGALWATLTPTTTGGLSTMNASSSDGGTALTSTAQAIKASAGNLYGYYIYNPNSSAQFVQFYNTASGSVTVGTTNPLFMLTIPATSAANLMFSYPVAFGTAMSWAATSTAGGNGAPATALDAVCWYK